MTKPTVRKRPRRCKTETTMQNTPKVARIGTNQGVVSRDWDNWAAYMVGPTRKIRPTRRKNVQGRCRETCLTSPEARKSETEPFLLINNGNEKFVREGLKRA